MKQTETTLPVVVLPEEVQAIALKVSEEKRAEVNNVLTQIFSGTADWKNQVDSIVVKDPSDKMGMNLAKTARLNAKNARLAAEKVFNGKRDEVQDKMLSYQTEDKLWLKAKQTMQILFKEIELSAEYKEKTAERYEVEQHELKVQTHLLKLASVAPEITRQEIEYMSDASFDVFLAGLVKAKEDAIWAEKEAQEKVRLAEIRKQRDQQRFEILAGTGLVYLNENFKYGDISYSYKDLCDLENTTFDLNVKGIVKEISDLKKAELAEKERLQKVAEEKEAEIKKQSEILRIEQEKAAEALAKQKAESDAKIAAEEAKQAAYEMQVAKDAKIMNDARIAAEEKTAAEKKRQDEIIAQQQATADAEKVRVAKLESRDKELRPYIVFIRDYDKMRNMPDTEYAKELAEVKKGAELQWEFDRKEMVKKQDEENAKLLLEKAPKKEKLTAWINGFVMGTPIGEDSDLLVQDILAKFSGFKKWAKGEINKL